METHFHTETLPRMFITVLSVIIPNWKWAKHPSTVKWAHVMEESRNGIWLKRNKAGCVQQQHGKCQRNYAKRSQIKKIYTQFFRLLKILAPSQSASCYVLGEQLQRRSCCAYLSFSPLSRVCKCVSFRFTARRVILQPQGPEGLVLS